MKVEGKVGEFFRVEELNSSNHAILQEKFSTEKTILWFLDSTTQLIIDNVPYKFKKNQVITLTEFYNIDVVNMGETKMFQFNRSFYCIVEHDSEVDCKGILFFGAKHLPVLNLSNDDTEKLDIFWKLIQSELLIENDLQLSMLGTLMKQILIICTRQLKQQADYLNSINKNQLDIIREFTFLVEMNYLEKHTVAEYAEMLNRSPKTLANLFSKNDHKSPLQFIQERRLLEATRYLQFTNNTISEVSDALNFTDVQTFNRFFKRHLSQSPSEFRAFSLNKNKVEER
ncbi:helix-turn-helix domain-containing protein [Flammeovirga kamogawensis]|uniref:Helix-turn-helix transcriptional regulator n=1 Tax=Flammeovirga kamogawensis TaxID=373891 RepID=A0ABX8H152_9BACT|nr:AraC family transcriptional regulator [Flammeovirga kamogawensis]MBB6463299.1 AraC-like DNA-binding protein [Flammeovirga kamogawensis]QWG09551.1 helix-turn-helix transcriptional regulator [Flammeovirga kamogawensis]TRX65065.1 helix-turn-helix transcriptional regulator [Flammeovirga kamogawensis]